MGKKLRTLVKVGAVAAGAGVAGKIISDSRKKAMKIQKEESIEADLSSRDYAGNQAYFIGGGLGSRAGAAYLIRDCKFPGEQITIYEGMHLSLIHIFGGMYSDSTEGDTNPAHRDS